MYAEHCDDTYLISYPKSGRTWLRILLGHYLSHHFAVADVANRDLIDLTSLHEKDRRVPRIVVDHDGAANAGWLDTADKLETSKAHYANSDVIFLARDPRDVVVSSYFHKNRRRTSDKHDHYPGDLSSYVRSKIGSIDCVIRFYNIWARERHGARPFLLLRYEDLHADTGGQLTRALRFLGIEGVNDDLVRAAVRFASFESMRDMERLNALSDPRLAPTNSTDHESFKVRKGKVHGFRDYLADDDIRYLNDKIRKDLDPAFRYD